MCCFWRLLLKFCPTKRYHLAGDNKRWKFFLIYVFTKDKIDLVEELGKLNLILVDHEQAEVYENFSAYIDQTQPGLCFFLLLLLRKEKQKINLSFFVKFWRSVDENSSITCSATDDKFSILYYFNSKHLDLDYLLSLLNTFVREQQLDRLAWKFPFKTNAAREEPWVYDYFKRTELHGKKDFCL